MFDEKKFDKLHKELKELEEDSGIKRITDAITDETIDYHYSDEDIFDFNKKLTRWLEISSEMIKMNQ